MPERSIAEGAASGVKALKILETTDFDVIVLDVKMPDMDGIETLRHIKKMKPEIEVIMLTGHASVEFGLKGMQLGAFDYVMKPAPLNELLDTIRTGLQQKTGRDPLIYAAASDGSPRPYHAHLFIRAVAGEPDTGHIPRIGEPAGEIR